MSFDFFFLFNLFIFSLTLCLGWRLGKISSLNSNSSTREGLLWFLNFNNYLWFGKFFKVFGVFNDKTFSAPKKDSEGFWKPLTSLFFKKNRSLPNTELEVLNLKNVSSYYLKKKTPLTITWKRKLLKQVEKQIHETNACRCLLVKLLGRRSIIFYIFNYYLPRWIKASKVLFAKLAGIIFLIETIDGLGWLFQLDGWFFVSLVLNGLAFQIHNESSSVFSSFSLSILGLLQYSIQNSGSQPNQ